MSLEQLFHTEFEHQLAEREDQSGLGRDEFTTSGGTTRRPLEDVAWWLDNGPQQVANWMTWRKEKGLVIWRAPDGRAGIELDFDLDLGGIRVRGGIDRVVEARIQPVGEIYVVDLKTGNSQPTDRGLQLGVYKVALEVQYGVTVNWGVYFKTRGAKEQKVISLQHYTPQLVRNMMIEFYKARAAGAYPPRPQQLCDWCGARDFCAAYGGEKAKLYDPVHPDYAGAYS